jgi:hypothetical protein
MLDSKGVIGFIIADWGVKSLTEGYAVLMPFILRYYTFDLSVPLNQDQAHLPNPC